MSALLKDDLNEGGVATEKLAKAPMSNKKLLLVISGWIFITLINYYYVNFFFLAFTELGMILTLLVLTFSQLAKVFKDKTVVRKFLFLNFLVYGLLLLLTLSSKPNEVIEKLDWRIFKAKRISIVNDVKSGKLNATGRVCELPFKFPVVSNGGNDIIISRSAESTTVQFFIFRNFFNAPSIYFIYTDDLKTIKLIDKKIIENPDGNWKLEKNWYRTFDEL